MLSYQKLNKKESKKESINFLIILFLNKPFNFNPILDLIDDKNILK